MDEPSVLDYVKSRLAFWRREKIEIPPEPPVLSPVQDPSAEAADALTVLETQPPLIREQAELSPIPVSSSSSGIEDRTAEPVQVVELEVVNRPVEQVITHRETTWLPWLVFAASLAAITAQFLFDQSERQEIPGIYFYIAAAVLTIWAYFRKDILPAAPPPEAATGFSLKMKRDGAIILIPAALLAFISFGGNKFTVTNVILWALSLIYLFRMLYLPPRRSFSQLAAEWVDRLKKPRWTIQIQPWTIILLFSIVIIGFFRLYQLDQLPPEMVSDHAEKILDVFDVKDGKTSIFFPRNTGREAFQFYLTAFVADLFGTGLSFLSLKIGTTIGGLITVLYIYWLGKEAGNRWVGLFAALLAGMGYWPNIISRIGLRFPLYPWFVAPTLFYLLRGLRTSNRNDFIWAGLALGIGLHGYTAIRILPVLILVAFVLFLIHRQSVGRRKQAWLGLVIIALTSFVVFLPLARYVFDDPDMFIYRSLTRMGDLERPLPGPPLEIFFNNLWRAVTMFFWHDGEVWVHSIPGRPALDMISAALLFLGVVILLVRYIKSQHWKDLFWILSIPILLMPSILSLAFPNENPNLNRTAGAYVPVFIICGFALDAILRGVRLNITGKMGGGSAVVLGVVLLTLSGFQNYNLVFNQYQRLYLNSAWNTSEMGGVIRGFVSSTGSPENAWVVAFPYWVDTRLVGINAGYPTRDTAVSVENLAETNNNPGAKLFLLNREDQAGLEKLRELYPEGRLKEYRSRVESKNFYMYLVPAFEDELLE